MKNLTLNDLHLTLTNLLTHRAQSLRKMTMGKVYEDALRAQLVRLSAFPGIKEARGRSLAAELKETDARHDAIGGSVDSLLEACLRSPLVSAEDKAAAERVRAAFVPSRSEFNDSYVDEAARARRRQGRVAELEADLVRFAVPGGGSLRDWVEAYIDAGIQLDALLQQRAKLDEAASGEGPVHAGALRSETIGLLGRTRTALADDIAFGGLSAELDEAIFGFVDMVQKMRGSGGAKGGVEVGDDEDGPGDVEA